MRDIIGYVARHEPVETARQIDALTNESTDIYHRHNAGRQRGSVQKFGNVIRRFVNWLKDVVKRLGTFVLSLICGIFVPLSTLPAEWWVRGELDGVSWFSAGVTYVAGIGLISSMRGGLVVMLIAAGWLAFVYGVDMRGVFDWTQANPGKQPLPLNAIQAQLGIGFASLMYMVERFGRHVVQARPFLE